METQQCWITGEGISETNYVQNDTAECIEYKLNYAGRDLHFKFAGLKKSWSEDIDSDLEKYPTYTIGNYINRIIDPVRPILLGLIFNNKWIPKGELLTLKKIQSILNEYDYPKTPKEKFDNLFQKLYKFQAYDGEIIKLNEYVNNHFNLKGDAHFYFFYFRKYTELKLYIETLFNDGYIVIYNKVWSNTSSYQITYKGLNHYLDLSAEGSYSNNCFVAMSFDDADYPIFEEAIYPACDETGFDAKRIDYELYDSDKTINDAMIALIKKCKFMIADFTQQRHNVYFEAGYGLGRGMKIIYTCKKEFFDTAKFDTNHFPHIVYETNEELKQKLIDKINAYILL